MSLFLLSFIKKAGTLVLMLSTSNLSYKYCLGAISVPFIGYWLQFTIDLFRPFNYDSLLASTKSSARIVLGVSKVS